MSELLDCIQIETGPNPAIAIIWMHGLGASGHDFASMPTELDLRGLPAIRFVFPHANHLPMTFQGGAIMRSWYDFSALDLSREQDEPGLRSSQRLVEALIAREKARGIPASRIVLAGFSQGCAMTLQTGLRPPEPLAGLLCLSGYVPIAPTVPAERSQASLATPIFMGHGSGDAVISVQWARESRDLLKSLGYQVEWHEYMMAHNVIDEEVVDIGAWLRQILGAATSGSPSTTA